MTTYLLNETELITIYFNLNGIMFVITKSRDFCHRSNPAITQKLPDVFLQQTVDGQCVLTSHLAWCNDC